MSDDRKVEVNHLIELTLNLEDNGYDWKRNEDVPHRL